MKWLNCVKIRLSLIGFVAAIVFDGGSTKADFTFGEPVNLGSTINSSASDTPGFVSADGLEMYLTSDRSGGYGSYDIWMSVRATQEDEWSVPVNLGPTINTNRPDYLAYLSQSGLELYFTSYRRAGGSGGDDIWVSRRTTINDAWGEPTNLGPAVNSSANEWSPSISPDGLELYFGTDQSAGYGNSDIWVSKRVTINEPWGLPMNLGPSVNSSACEGYIFLSSDGLALFFSEDLNQPIRPGGYGNTDMWVSRRASISDTWDEPVNLGPIVNSSSLDFGPRISADGSMLYFGSERSGGFGGTYGDIWQASIIPIVDFNGDGICDIDDLVIMIENWNTDNYLCDIGPMPWGDGIVDRADLEVLMKYYNQVVDVTTYYKLDETEGDIACDSSGYYCDANVIGGPNWLPDNGMIDGAVELDGIDDYISTPFILNPRETSEFSVFTWVKGALPGQVIVSQDNSSNWLSVDPNGCLMTELKGGRFACDLFSETIITDGDWHRVGFTWDGVNRILYVDDVIAAIDTQNNLPSSVGGLYIGAGKDLEPGTFFSGLIDDVRIYNRVIVP